MPKRQRNRMSEAAFLAELKSLIAGSMASRGVTHVETLREHEARLNQFAADNPELGLLTFPRKGKPAPGNRLIVTFDDQSQLALILMRYSDADQFDDPEDLEGEDWKED